MEASRSFLSGAFVFNEAWSQAWRMDPVLTVSECADKHRILSGVASAEPGEWRTARAPFSKEPMDCLSVGSLWHRVALMFPTQMSKSEIILNFLLYIIRYAPGPALLVQPTVKVAERFVKQRLNTMIQETPVLRELVKEPRSRASGNTLFEKEFPGGILIIGGANSAASLASMPIRYLLLDEVDKYPADVEREGNPIELAEERTSNFHNAKILICSSPSIKGRSAIEVEHARGDQRRFYVPCLECGFMSPIVWSEDREPGAHFIAWDEGHPETAGMVCGSRSCRKKTRESLETKTEMLARGEWRATAEGDGETASFQIPGMCAPYGWKKKSWPAMAKRWVRVHNDPPRRKTFVNSGLAEPYEDRSEAVDPKLLENRLEAYPTTKGAVVPHGVGVIGAAIDTQDDRLEGFIWGFGADEQSWLLATHAVYGDPEEEKVWLQMKTLLLAPLKHESGKELSIDLCCVDTAGHKTEAAYKFCKANPGFVAIRGGKERGRPLVMVASNKNSHNVWLFTLCVDTGKDTLYSRLRIQTPGPGYVHLPIWVHPTEPPEERFADLWAPDFLDQLTAEKAIWSVGKDGRKKKDWVKVYERNEGLDGAIYCMAVPKIMKLTPAAIAARAEEWSKPPEETSPAQPQRRQRRWALS